jgi:hypothetical protein
MQIHTHRFVEHLTPNKLQTSDRVTPCFFEINDYGFKQKRINCENVEIPRADESRGIEFNDILNPKKSISTYGS